RNTSISGAMCATSFGVSTTIMSTPTMPGTRRGTTRPARSAADRTHHRRRRDLFPQMAGARRLSVLAVLGEHPQLVGDPPPAERQAGSLQRSEARPRRADARHRDVFGRQGRRKELAAPRRALFIRLHEGACREIGTAGWRAVGRRRLHLHQQGHQWPVAELLTQEDNSRYESRAIAELGTDCARWLMTGERS